MVYRGVQRVQKGSGVQRGEEENSESAEKGGECRGGRELRDCSEGRGN